MNAETLHDAIGLLPADLVSEADTLRTRKPRIIPWKRYAALAACFALTVSCGLFAMKFLSPKGATEAALQAPAAAAPLAPAADEAPAEEAARFDSANGSCAITEESAKENAVPNSAEPEAPLKDTTDIICQRVETPVKPTTVAFSSQSAVTLVTSPEELETYLTEKDWIYDFTYAREVCAIFDEAWFENHDLLVMRLHAAYPDFPYTVTSIVDTEGTDPMGWDWFILYTTPVETHPEENTTSIHLLIELEKNLISPEDAILPVADPES